MASEVRPPNVGMVGSSVGHSSQPVAPVAVTGAAPPNLSGRFSTQDALANHAKSTEPSPIAPGDGLIPNAPWDQSGRPARMASPMPDNASDMREATRV